MKKAIEFLTDFIALCSLLALTFSASFIGSTFSNSSNLAWYETLQHPFFTPPSWAFGVVWPLLYFLMSCAAWIVWKKQGFLSTALYWYYAQLAINTLYMPLFFHYKLLLSSCLWIALLLVFIVQTMRSFFKVNPIAGWLLVPYCIWSIFALNLSFFIWYLNK